MSRHQFIIGTIRGVTFGERFKKNFYCGVYEVISLRKWPSSYDWGGGGTTCIFVYKQHSMVNTGNVNADFKLPTHKRYSVLMDILSAKFTHLH